MNTEEPYNYYNQYCICKSRVKDYPPNFIRIGEFKNCYDLAYIAIKWSGFLIQYIEGPISQDYGLIVLAYTIGYMYDNRRTSSAGVVYTYESSIEIAQYDFIIQTSIIMHVNNTERVCSIFTEQLCDNVDLIELMVRKHNGYIIIKNYIAHVSLNIAKKIIKYDYICNDELTPDLNYHKEIILLAHTKRDMRFSDLLHKIILQVMLSHSAILQCILRLDFSAKN